MARLPASPAALAGRWLCCRCLGLAALVSSLPASAVSEGHAFAPSAELSAWAHAATAGSAPPGARAAALYEAMLALLRRGELEADKDNTPKARAPKSAAVLFAATQTPGADRRAGCYELSVLFIAAARAVGLEAFGLERADVEGTGQIGHIVAGVRDGGRRWVFDLQNQQRDGAGVLRELGDAELAAHHHNHASVAHYLAGELSQALSQIDRALALAPNSPSFQSNRATVLAALGELDQAAAEVAHAVRAAPRVPLFRYQLGRLLLAAGRPLEAEVELRRALALRPAYGLARRDLGWALLMARRDAEAVAELEAVLRQAPVTPEAALYLGLTYLVLERKDDAARTAREALTTSGDTAELSALLAAAQAPTARDDGDGRLAQLLLAVRSARAGARPR